MVVERSPDAYSSGWLMFTLKWMNRVRMSTDQQHAIHSNPSLGAVGRSLCLLSHFNWQQRSIAGSSSARQAFVPTWNSFAPIACVSCDAKTLMIILRNRDPSFVPKVNCRLQDEALIESRLRGIIGNLAARIGGHLLGPG